MRLLLTSIVFLASLAAVVLVHAPRAHAGWERPQQMDSGQSPRVRVAQEALFVAYAKGYAHDPSQLVIGEGNEPMRRIRVPRAGRVVAFDIDVNGQFVALREVERGNRTRLLELDGRRWRRISGATSAVDAKLAVAESGAAVAAWLQREESHWVVHAAVRLPGAERFGAAQRLSGLTRRGHETMSVAVDDGASAVVTWTEGGDLTMARTVGPAFTTPVRVHDRTEEVAGAFTAVSAISGQTAVVAFTHLADREPPEYRLRVATMTGDTPPVVETVATDVSALDVAAAVDPAGAPLVLSSPMGPPHLLKLYRRATSWAEALSIRATGAPSTIRYQDGAVTWTEGLRGFAWFSDRKLSLGRAYDIDVAVEGPGATLVWDRSPGRTMRIARFTP